MTTLSVFRMLARGVYPGARNVGVYELFVSRGPSTIVVVVNVGCMAFWPPFRRRIRNMYERRLQREVPAHVELKVKIRW